MEGKAIMNQNFSLSEDEVEEGFILTCQAHPITENIVVDFDEM
jgi:ring-1,2-phenylacetyl-CoA epoxidase subunit PaaE